MATASRIDSSGGGGGGNSGSSSILAVVLDLHPSLWDEGTTSVSAESLVGDSLIALNAHLALHADNALTVIAARPGDSQFLYPITTTADRQLGHSAKDNSNNPVAASAQYEPFRVMNHTVRMHAKAVCREPADPSTASDFPGAIGRALCYINRIRRQNGSTQQQQQQQVQKGGSSGGGGGGSGTYARDGGGSRRGAGGGALEHVLSDEELTPAKILVVTATGCAPAQYLPIMNLTFAAKSLRVPLDICALDPSAGGVSAVFQQSASLTGGVALALDVSTHGLAQALLTVFLATGSARVSLVAPPPPLIDYEATCICHQNPVTTGYVCSVCLSIHCKRTPRCKACHTFVA